MNNLTKDILEKYKPVFIKWERRRIYYNLILFITFIYALIILDKDIIFKFKSQIVICMWILYGIGANILYLVAPISESYFSWLGFHKNWFSWIIFIVGIIISVPLVFICVLYPI
jgi:hypothetical protein